MRNLITITVKLPKFFLLLFLLLLFCLQSTPHVKIDSILNEINANRWSDRVVKKPGKLEDKIIAENQKISNRLQRNERKFIIKNFTQKILLC